MIKSLSEAEMTEVYRQRMKRDFPPNELKPLTRILAQKRKHIALCLGYYKEDQMIGYAVRNRTSGSAVCCWTISRYLTTTADRAWEPAFSTS